MIEFRTRKLLAVAIGATLMLGLAPAADAQVSKHRERAQQERQQKSSEVAKEAARYPLATREEPSTKGSSGLRKQLNAMITAYNDDQQADARAKAAAILSDGDANQYDRSLAAQISGNAAYDMDDRAGAMASLQQAIDFNGLDNNAHYSSMFMLAQLMIAEGREVEGLAMLDRFMEETKSTDPQHLILKGNTLYNLERYEEAAVATRAAIEASPDPDPMWTQLLMGIHLELDQPDEAMRIAEQLAARDPSNKRSQLNLATVYLQNDRMDRAAAVLEQVRSSGQLESPEEYRQLYATYLNMDGRESEAIAVIEEGLSKGILKPSYEVYVALGQSYYFSKNDAKAIEAYQKAAPLDEDGETYLNLARVLWQADRIGEAKQAAQRALDKGISKPEEARKIIALP